ncbi:MAG: T9SS type A sorting domain-containing protein, partial [Bacteroidota bacterium]
STASETNNAGFYLEKSTQGDSFSQIGWIPGHGTTNTQYDYQFIDSEVEKNRTYYYKLKQIDFDGTSSNSDIVSARLSGQGVQVSAWPNPFNTSTNLIINLQQDKFVEAWVVNAIGQEVDQLTRKELSKGSHPFIFDLQAKNCKSGIYTVIVKVDDEVFRLRVVAYDH